jgi:hypothetical protein
VQLVTLSISAYLLHSFVVVVVKNAFHLRGPNLQFEYRFHISAVMQKKVNYISLVPADNCK